MSLFDQPGFGDDELRLIAEAFEIMEHHGCWLSELPREHRHAIKALALVIANHDARQKPE